MNIRTIKKAILASLIGISLTGAVGISQAEFETENGWDGHLYPSYIISTATMKTSSAAEEDDDVLGDPRGLLGISIEADKDDQTITVTITCDAIMEPSVFTGTLPESGETYTVKPKIKFKYDQLAKYLQTGPVTVTYKVEVGDNEAKEKAETLTMRSVNDCPFLVIKDEKQIDVSYMFAAYVNEQHPFVDKVLREALDTRIVDSFSGYQAKKKQEVFRQVYALWHALSLRDVRYSSITTSVAESESVASQHVRLIDESINNGQANCVDGSVLMASLRRKIGIEPILVLVPGHCYLAYVLTPDGKSLGALETTLIGSEVDDAVSIADLEGVVGSDAQAENSWKTFTSATAMGIENLKKCLKKIEEAKNQDHQLVWVMEARKHGILPIAFQSNQKFSAAPTGNSDSESEDK